MLSEEQAKELIAGALPAMQEAIKQRAIDSLTHELHYKLAEAVQREVASFVAEEIIPSVREHLLASKDGLLAAAIAATGEAGTLLQQAVVEQVAKKLESSWGRQEVLKALFGN